MKNYQNFYTNLFYDFRKLITHIIYIYFVLNKWGYFFLVNHLVNTLGKTKQFKKILSPTIECVQAKLEKDEYREFL